MARLLPAVWVNRPTSWPTNTLRLAEQKIVRPWSCRNLGEVHRVNSRVPRYAKIQRMSAHNDVTVRVLEKSDLTNRPEARSAFLSKDGVIVFNQKVRQAAPGAKRKVIGIVKIGVLVEVDGKMRHRRHKLPRQKSVLFPREFRLRMASGCTSRPIAPWLPWGDLQRGIGHGQKPSAPMAELNGPTAGFLGKSFVSSSLLRGHGSMVSQGKTVDSRSLF